MMIATNRIEIAHESQSAVEAETNARIFDGLKIADKIEALAAEYAEQVLPFSGSMPEAKAQARKWICEALCDYVASIADYELIFLK